MRVVRLGAIVIAVALVATPAIAQRTIIGPNIRVSSDPHAGHAETDMAVNPRDSLNLIGASIEFGRSDGGTTCRVFVSHDGGNSWTEKRFEEDAEYGGADPQVVFDTNGVAYFLWIAHGTEIGGKGIMPLYRSADGGRSWERVARLGVGDHPMLVIDHTSSRFAGRLYGSAMYGVRRPGLFYTDDGGRTVTGPIFIPNPKNYFLLDDLPIVLSDGTLFLPYRLWDDGGGTKAVTTGITAFVISHDGGKTFSDFNSIIEHPYAAYSSPTEYPGTFVAENPAPVFAVDSRVRVDRIYMAFNDVRSGVSRVYVLHSADRGASWSDPVAVSTGVPSWSAQYLPLLAVAPDGTVGVAWQDTRNDSTGHSLDYYFTASRDGGRTFLPARRITSAPSRPFAGANLRLAPNWVDRKDDRQTVAFNSAYRRWPEGGDYMGMAAHGNAVFQPLWVDSRTGVSQLMTARIQVRDSVIAATPADLAESNLGKRIELVFGQPIFDDETHETRTPVSLRNVSDEIIYAPLRVHVDSLSHLVIRSAADSAGTIDYTKALGDLPFLSPGAVTEAIDWVLRRDGVREMASVVLKVTGRIR